MLLIPRRYRGPTESGNGGYSAGTVAALLGAPGGAVEVTLRAPPPLETPMRVERGETLRAYHGNQLIMEARRAILDVDVPVVTPESAREAATRTAELENAAFAECFTCGPTRAPDDGLRIFPRRPLPEGPASALWRPHPSLFVNGQLPLGVVWAALDCPGFYAVGRRGEVAVLGKMTALVDADLAPEEPCVVVGISLGREGRKLQAATALFGAEGRRIGRARQTWIQLTPPELSPPHAEG